jgi:DNA polymerase-3 subunit epsilon
MSFPGFLTLIDFEATSRFKHSARAIEIGLVALDEKLNEVARYSSIIRPPVRVSREIMLYTRLSPTEISKAPTFANIWPEIHSFFNNRVLVAQNASYDLGVLESELSDLGIASRLPSICTYEMAQRNLKKVTKDLKLPTICEYFGIPLDAHKALDDAIAAGEVLKKFLGMNPSEYSVIGRAIDTRVNLPLPTNIAKPALNRIPTEFIKYAESLEKNSVVSTQLIRLKTDDEIEKLAQSILQEGRSQVCLTGDPSMGKDQFARDLKEIGFAYTLGDIRKTKTAFFVIGVKDTGNGKIQDAQLHKIPTFTDADYQYLLVALCRQKGIR